MIVKNSGLLFTFSAWLVCSTLCAVGYAQSVKREDHWPQWRGPNRDDVSSETGLVKQWPEGGPHLVWQTHGLGRGIASVAIANNTVYTVGYHFPGPTIGVPSRGQTKDGRRRTRTVNPQGEYVIALDARNGQLKWATRVGAAVFENHLMRWLSQRTPTVDGDRLYVVTAAGVLICLQSSDGLELWRKNYIDDFGGIEPRWGFCDYPLVDGERLICNPGGTDSTVVALNKHTGKLIWKCTVPGAAASGHAATIASRAGGLRHYVVFNKSGLIGVSASDGRILWKYTRWAHDLNALTPILRGDKLLCANAYRGTFIAQLGFRSVNDGLEVTEERVSSPGIYAVNAFQDNMLVVGDRLYGAGRSGILACIDANSLEVRWRTGETPDDQAPRRRGMSGMVYVDGQLYVRYSNGLMTLVEPQVEGCVERGAFTIPGSATSRGATMPVVAGGYLFLRDDERLFCYDIRENSENEAHETTVVQLKLNPDLNTVPNEPTADQRLHSVFVPTPPDVVERMLDLAEVKRNDVVCDLGSGDGRIVIAAAKRSGCRSIGYEISKNLVGESRKAAEAAGVQNLATFENKDIFDVDFSEATVVTLYLLPEQNKRLLGQLEKLAPDSRIVAHQNPIPGVRPERVIRVDSEEDDSLHTLYFWTTPLTKTSPANSDRSR